MYIHLRNPYLFPIGVSKILILLKNENRGQLVQTRVNILYVLH